MTRRMTTIALFVATSLVLSAPSRPVCAEPWQCGQATPKSSRLDERRWPNDAFPITIAVSAEAADAIAGLDDALDFAIARWNSVPCASSTLVRVSGDARVVVTVTDDIELPGDAPPVYGYTLQAEEDPDFYTAAELVLNVEVLTAAADCGDLLLRGLLTHELGHVLGLGHSDVLPSTMDGYVDSPEIFALSRLYSDDVEALCAMYPCLDDNGCGDLDVDADWTAAYYDDGCAGTIDCPPPYVCTLERDEVCEARCGVAGAEPDAPDGATTVGASCSASTDCGGPFDFCIDDDPPRCGRFDGACEVDFFTSIEGERVVQCIAAEPAPRRRNPGCAATSAEPRIVLLGAVVFAAVRRRSSRGRAAGQTSR